MSLHNILYEFLSTKFNLYLKKLRFPIKVVLVEYSYFRLDARNRYIYLYPPLYKLKPLKVLQTLITLAPVYNFCVLPILEWEPYYYHLCYLI